ncbi:MAG: 16S rRNA (guanine(527)-N(7))-methyltransferase RsmG [Atopobiaceae bacterium]|nr:16S rRNA (guanine(527)-N(7))-methyltransferase RsmG [Atopobiaceae bacterium]MCH4180828.1 16S rRNA (guanine(527)-N(7))-methyltransferase RsmG [Atopobiaceae bacterium]MCH4214129.1 16S rRNA (guanine(527)-N(7))-methyltransferase RsmG [Atopobiaceae bacterium]MCH4229697.1 16S rRNA (guanine(527)-N(7))-methyltransferase RsmG [Atopobiaceae bacterium]MCH4276481.1 16S rRNA (guanine(527)-N(7))-methyltransferase RsmG [Atopobiaceae bacterium]
MDTCDTVEAVLQSFDPHEERRVELVEQASSIGIDLTDRECDLLLGHLALMLEKNKVMNLTGIKDSKEAVNLHVIDSLMMLKSFQITRGRFVDIGTGGGFPGIPLAIMTGRPGVLMDSVHKKVVACSEFISELGLGNQLDVTSKRAEDYALSHKGEFGVVVARAVAPLGILCEYASPLLMAGGSLLVTKGRLSDDELAQGEQAASICGLEIVSRETSELPDSNAHREIILLKKCRKPSIRLPRQVGEAKKHPLGE